MFGFMKKILKMAAAAVVSIGAGIAVAATVVASAPAWVGGAVACTVAAAAGAMIYAGSEAYKHVTKKPDSKGGNISTSLKDNLNKTVSEDGSDMNQVGIDPKEMCEMLFQRIEALEKSKVELERKIDQLITEAKIESKEGKVVVSKLKSEIENKKHLQTVLQKIIDAPDKNAVLDKYKDTLASMGLTDEKSNAVNAHGCGPGFFKTGIEPTQHNPIPSAVVTC